MATGFDSNVFDTTVFQSTVTITKSFTGTLSFAGPPPALNKLRSLWTRVADVVGTVWTRLVNT